MSNQRFTVSELEKRFHIAQRDVSLLFVLCCLLQTGDTLETLCGSLKKTSEFTLEIMHDPALISTIVRDLLPDYVTT